MLSRAALPLLRPRSFQVASRLAFSKHQIRGIRNDRGRLREPGDFKTPSSSSSNADKYQQPLRSVPSQESENLKADSAAHGFSDIKYQAPPSSQSSQQAPSKAPLEHDEPEPEPSTSQPLPDLRDGIPSDYKPLPDLTQGIPSTIDAELSQNLRGTSKGPLNITEGSTDPRSAETGDRGGDGLPRSSYVSSSDRRRSALTKYFYISLGLGTILYGVYMGRDWNEEETEHDKNIPNGYTPGLMYARAMARFGSTVSYYKDPVTKKLLPDAHLMDPNMPPYTLVLGLEDVLVHSEWSREHGWRIAKRPGLDYFIKYLSLYYELVIFSTQPFFTVDQIHRKIDPYQMIFPLYREMTVYEDGGYVKDLSYLNRDLNKVVMIDSDPHHVKKQPENAIVLPKWSGDPNDTTLVDLIPFLEYIANLGYSDLREVLKSFEGTNIPQEFARRQKLMRDDFEAKQAEKRKGRRAGGGFSLGSMFGAKQQRQDGLQSIHDAELEGKMFSDVVRERGQETYQRLSAHLATEGPKIIAEREAMEKKAQEAAMADMKTGMFGWLSRSDIGEKESK